MSDILKELPKPEIPADHKKMIEQMALKERIYEPKYGGKDHSGYETMMKYEINDEREECFEKGAEFGWHLRDSEVQKLNNQTPSNTNERLE